MLINLFRRQSAQGPQVIRYERAPSDSLPAPAAEASAKAGPDSWRAGPRSCSGSGQGVEHPGHLWGGETEGAPEPIAQVAVLTFQKVRAAALLVAGESIRSQELQRP